jgi:hypothetical protein
MVKMVSSTSLKHKISRHLQFQNIAGRYQELAITNSRIWLPELELGVGLWQGTYEGVTRLWLRWFDVNYNWILTPFEQERTKSEHLAARLKQLGINPEE